jgi:hypothetical protein
MNQFSSRVKAYLNPDSDLVVAHSEDRGPEIIIRRAFWLPSEVPLFRREGLPPWSHGLSLGGEPGELLRFRAYCPQGGGPPRQEDLDPRLALFLTDWLLHKAPDLEEVPEPPPPADPDEVAELWGEVRALEAVRGLPMASPESWRRVLGCLSRLTVRGQIDLDEAWGIAARLVSMPLLGLGAFRLRFLQRTANLGPEECDITAENLCQALDYLATAAGQRAPLWEHLRLEPIWLEADPFFFRGADWRGLQTALRIHPFKVLLQEAYGPVSRDGSSEPGKVAGRALQEAPRLVASGGLLLRPLLMQAVLTPPSQREALMCRRLNP